MSDIIKDAQQLLGGATPGAWMSADSDIIAEDSNRFIATVSEYSGLDELSEEYANVQLIASAPELAQALSEETWEYQVQARSMQRPAWQPSTNGILQKWYGAEDIEEAKSNARMYTPYFHGREKVEIRVLRRRVSPVEVINE